MKIRAKTRNLISLFAVVVAILLINMLGSENNIVSQTSHSKAQSPSWIVENAEIKHFDTDGKLNGIIKAQQVEYYDQPEHVKLTLPEIYQGQLDENSHWQKSWRATANEGYSDDIGSIVSLKGEVNVYNLLNHYHLAADKLEIDNANTTLSSDSAVTVTAPDITVVSKGINANWYNEKIQLLSNVNVQIDTH